MSGLMSSVLRAFLPLLVEMFAWGWMIFLLAFTVLWVVWVGGVGERGAAAFFAV